MKIECDQCGAKYSIADDKVRGKTFKIRCKKCNNVVIVDNKSSSEDAAEEGEASSAESLWYLAMEGETVGPLDSLEIRRRIAIGEIDGGSMLWQEGFTDWLPLREIEAFADLMDELAMSEAQSFSSPETEEAVADRSSSEESAPIPQEAVEAPVSEPETALAAAPDVPEPVSQEPVSESVKAKVAESPREESVPVSQPQAFQSQDQELSGARSENSVLFSLDSITPALRANQSKASSTQSAATPMGLTSDDQVTPFVNNRTSPPTSSTSEGSGLIDIRAMGAMLGSGGAAGVGGRTGANDGGSGNDVIVPSFGGTGFGGLSAAPVEVYQPTAGVSSTPPAPQKSNGFLYAVIGVMFAGLVGLGAYVLYSNPQQQSDPSKSQSSQVSQSSAETKSPELGKATSGELAEAKDSATPPVAQDEGITTEDTGEDNLETEGSATTDSPVAAADTKKLDKKPDTTKKDKDKGKTLPKDPTPSAKEETKPKEPTEGKTNKPAQEKPPADKSQSVECLINPNAPGCKTGGSKPSSGTQTPSAPPSGDLPQKLSSTDLKSGVSAQKSSAKSKCGNLAKPGDKVEVKLSIRGATGEVVSSTVQSSTGGSQLGNCVAQELKKATFKKFKTESIGYVTTVLF